jgi:hemerythrin-like domain-containing protein
MNDIQNIKLELINHLKNNVPYENMDMSDLGNEIGFILGKYFNDNKNGFEENTFFHGLEHGISISNDTHF